MIHKLALPEIRELIELGDKATLSDVLNSWIPPDLAALVAGLPESQELTFLEALEPPLRASVFEYLDLERQERIIQAAEDPEIAAILNDMAPDDRTALLAELPKALTARLINLLSPDQRAVAQSLLNYDRDTIARLMTPDYVAIRADWTVKRVLDHVRTHGKNSETLNVLYVIDDDNRLIDDLRIREFLLAPLHAHVSDLMNKSFVCLLATDDKRHAVQVFKKYDRAVLPVADAKGHLVGIVTIDDVMDVAEEQATQ